jgi:hypothetical protein
MTEELLRLLWIVEKTLAMVPELDRCIADILDNPIIRADELSEPTEAGL